jgi:hypothetical protein
MEQEDWREIEHLAETAMKMLENPSTRDMAMSLVDRAQVCINHLKSIAENKGAQV